MNLLTQIKHKTQKGEEVIMDIGAKASNVLPENFVEQKERSNLAAKDKLPVIFGKLSKWYADLRPVAWSGSYSDLTNKPTIPEGSAANYQVANNDTTEAEGFVADARIVRTHGLEIDGLSRDLNQRFPDGTGLQWDGTNFWGTTADGMKVKLGSLTYRDFTVTPTANSGSMSIDISDIPNYKDLILWETLFPRMLSDLDMANWNTSMLRTGVGYDWNYDADKGILSISSRHTECVLIQYGTGLKQRTVRVHYI
jgi:hypothetical protein